MRPAGVSYREPEAAGGAGGSRPRGVVRVAVVDDSVSVRKAIVRMLAAVPWDVLELSTGREALAGLEALRPDAVICDLSLPDVDGLEVCRFIRRSDELRHGAVVAMSGRVTPDGRRQALAAGADRVIAKPFRGEDLIAQVEELLAAAAARPAPAGPAPTGPAPASPAPASPVPGPAPARTRPPAAVVRILDEIERLPGLEWGRWRLAGGAGGRLGDPGARSAIPDDDALVAAHRDLAARLGLAEPRTLVIEAGGGEAVVLGWRPRHGLACLRLRSATVAGRARYLVHRLLAAAEAEPPRESGAGSPPPREHRFIGHY